MDKAEYYKLLQDERWHRKRHEILNRDNFKCRENQCNDGKILQVHHKFYAETLLPWEYPNFSLITLCNACHKYHHKYHNIQRFKIPTYCFTDMTPHGDIVEYFEVTEDIRCKVEDYY